MPPPRLKLVPAAWIDGLTGGLVLGCISFAAGFFGPMILTPSSNQGPLLGLLITGPLGFVLGLVIGTIVGFVRKKEQENAPGAFPPKLPGAGESTNP